MVKYKYYACIVKIIKQKKESSFEAPFPLINLNY